MDNIKITAGIFISLVALLSGVYYFESKNDVYYCESRDLIGICEKLSSGTGTRCYFNDSYKKCSEGWKKFEGFVEPDINYTSKVDVFANGEWYSCETAKGIVQSYSFCVSKSNKFAYIGELI